MAEVKLWNERKYYLHRNRWIRTTHPQIELSWDVWNFYNPDDTIEKKDGFVIHHINFNPLNNDIKNLYKMLFGNHVSLHHTNKKVSVESRKKISESNRGKKYHIGQYKIRFLKGNGRFYLFTLTIDDYHYQEYLSLISMTIRSNPLGEIQKMNDYYLAIS